MSVQEVNKLLKMHRQMSDMMKKMGMGVWGAEAFQDWAALSQSSQALAVCHLGKRNRAKKK